MKQQKLGDDGLGDRLQNRSPSYVEHVNSVVHLSMSESYRTGSSLRRIASSLGRTMSLRSSWMSMSSAGSKSSTAESSQIPLRSSDLEPQQGLINSGRRIFYKVAAPLLKGERAIWNELVDEAQLLPVPESRPANPERMLLDRACPGKLGSFSCSGCGGSSIAWEHWHPDNGDRTGIDILRNTKLHYAAASGVATVPLIRSLIDNGADIRARNSSGETFMHVLKTKKFIKRQGMSSYITLLRYLSDLNFPFSQRDVHGRTIAHLLCEDGWIFCFERSQYSGSVLLEVLQILNINMDALDNHGFNVGDKIQMSAEKFAHQLRFNDSDTSLAINRVKELLFLHRRRGFLQVSFREAFARSDWTSDSCIRWLQEANLIGWIDKHGDTPLTALLKSRRGEDQHEMLTKMIPKLVKLGVDINMRDRRGHTAIAIAAIRGSLSCVQALLNSGACVDVKNYQGRDIASIASWRMKMAKQEGKTQCYARILACVNLLMDIRAKNALELDIGIACVVCRKRSKEPEIGVLGRAYI
jgi:ankyrin repeat protein